MERIAPENIIYLKDREWTCPQCNTVHDRDVNASKNIKRFGLRNKPNVAQSEPLGCACSVEAHSSPLA